MIGFFRQRFVCKINQKKMVPKQNNDWLVLTALWVSFIIFVKLMEHFRAYKDLELGFRFDLFVVLPILLLVTGFIVWRNWDDVNNDN